MKFGAALLGLFILFLSVKSAMEPVSALVAVDACCKGKTEKDRSETPKSQKGNPGACDELCSPFKPCCPYITFTAVAATVLLPKTQTLTTDTYSLYAISFHSSYAVDFWQPPKLV